MKVHIQYITQRIARLCYLDYNNNDVHIPVALDPDAILMQHGRCHFMSHILLPLLRYLQ